MSESIVYAKNIVTQELNGVQGQIIDPDINTAGQILTITSTDPKSVAFQDPPEGTPSAVGFPDGYVLKIVDNTTNTINWETDALGPGPVVPLVLTGDNVNALKVQDNALNTKLNVDTIGDSVTLNGSNINLESSDIVSVDGVNQALLQTASASVIINGADVSVEGSDSKDKFIVKNGAGDSDFVVGTQSGDVSCLIRGGEVTQKLNVTDAGGKSMILCDTLNKDLISVGSLKLGDILTSQVYFETSNTNQTVNIKEDDNTSKLRVGRLNGNDMLRVDSVSNNVFIGGGSNTSAFIHDIDSAQFRVSSNNPPSLNLSAIGVFASFLQLSCGPSTNSIETNNPLNISSTNDLSLLANTSQLALQTGNMLFIEDTTTPAKNHIEIAYNSIVSKGNPLTNTANITFDTTTSTISQSDTTMDNISINNQPTLPEHGTRKDYVDGRVGNFFAGIADTLAVNSGSIVPAGVGTLTVPADAFQIGDSFHLNMAGDCTFSGDTLTIELFADGSAIGTISLSTENTSTPPNPWEIECDFTIRTLGATGSVSSNWDFTYVGTNQDQFVGSRSVEVNNIDTTIANTLDVQVTFSGTDTIRTRSMYLKKVF